MKYQGTDFVAQTVVKKSKEEFVENNVASHFTNKPEETRREWLADVHDLCMQKVSGGDNKGSNVSVSGNTDNGATTLNMDELKEQLASSQKEYDLLSRADKKTGEGIALHGRIQSLEAQIAALQLAD